MGGFLVYCVVLYYCVMMVKLVTNVIERNRVK